MSNKKNKWDMWVYTTTKKKARKRVKRLRNKADRRIAKHQIRRELEEWDEKD